ncbi:MAG: hypothetical protein LLG04_12405 [Parachlamydia sp.]|nr:hypothetical protein [Parachlamydia sp.]
MTAPLTMANYASQCCRELKDGCEKVEKERGKERSLTQRVGMVACQVLQYGAMGISLAWPLFFSFSFLVVGTAALVAFTAHIVAQSYFKITSPYEDRIINAFKKSPFITYPDNLPAAEQLRGLRTGYKYMPGIINNVAKVTDEQIDTVTKDNNLCAYSFINFFGSKGLSEKLNGKQPLTADESARKKQVLAMMQQVKVVYVTSQLLEGIQNIAKGKFVEAENNADCIQARRDVALPPHLKQKVELLAAKMKKPNQALLQEKVKQAVGKKFKLSDLDSVYKAVA